MAYFVQYINVGSKLCETIKEISKWDVDLAIEGAIRL